VEKNLRNPDAMEKELQDYVAEMKKAAGP